MVQCGPTWTHLQKHSCGPWYSCRDSSHTNHYYAILTPWGPMQCQDHHKGRMRRDASRATDRNRGSWIIIVKLIKDVTKGRVTGVHKATNMREWVTLLCILKQHSRLRNWIGITNWHLSALHRPRGHEWVIFNTCYTRSFSRWTSLSSCDSPCDKRNNYLFGLLGLWWHWWGDVDAPLLSVFR